jgi:uncharacterized sulfatase
MVYLAYGILLSCLMASPVSAMDYQLVPQAVAKDTFVFVGLAEDFTASNGGNIVNTGFVVTDRGVIVIDTGPSLRYGKQMRTAISRVTDKPVVQVYNTHLHPDHFLGNQAFKDVSILALEKTIAGIRAHGDRFTNNLYRLVDGWMQGTQTLAPSGIVIPGTWEFGGHRFRSIERAGHSDADLLILDETTGVLFAGDAVFNGRAPTTPHADLDSWVETLEFLSHVPFDVLIPGHGPVVTTRDSIQQTKLYIQWLQDTFQKAANEGVDMAELMFYEPPPEFRTLPVLRSEFQRSVSHLYPSFEARAVPLAQPR